MGLIKLELRCPKSSPMVASPDPQPQWTLNDLLSELNSLEQFLHGPPSAGPSTLKESEDLSRGKGMSASGSKPFAICISDDDDDDDDDDSEIDDEASSFPSSMKGARFSFNELDFSDSEESDEELCLETTQSKLMVKNSIEEGVLSEFEFEHQQKVKEQVRNTLFAIDEYQQNESERSSSAMSQLEQHTNATRKMDKRLDIQYQRMIAEVLSNHLTAVQRDHKQRSQIVEQRLRDDAALEVAKKEKAIQEEKLRLEKAFAEEEKLRKARKAEEAKRLAEEVARKASIEAGEKEAARARELAAAALDSKQAMEQKNAASTGTLSLMKEGNSVPVEKRIKTMAADAALKAEANRLKIYNEVTEKYHDVGQDFSKFGRKIHICLRQISGTIENVKEKAYTLLNIMNSHESPRSIYVIFAKKVISLCDNSTTSFDNIAFACGHVILLLTSKVPDIMEFVLAEFHKACIYTVPKHIQPSDRASNANDYRRMIGYREEDGKLESLESYLGRVRSYMKLYAALVQTEINGITNPHGLKEGWAWLARFLNTLPANRPTAVALETFLTMAGFALHRRYGRQFKKILDVVHNKYLPALRERDPHGVEVTRLEKAADIRSYKEEPEGRRLREVLLSEEFHG